MSPRKTVSPKTLPLRGRAIVTNTVLPSSIAKAPRSLACLVPDNFHLRRPPATSNGLGLTEDRLRLDRLPATAAANFFPPRVPRFASRSKKAVGGRQALTLCPSGAVRSSPVERPPSRSRLARPDWKKEHDNGNHRHLHQDRERLRLRPWKCPLAGRMVILARRRPGQAFPQRSEDNA